MSDPSAQPPDPARRRFFRQFAGDVMSSVGSVIGAAQSLQQTSAEAARELLGAADPEGMVPGGAGAAGASGSAAAAGGYRAPFRWDGDVCRVVDQRRLPDALAELEVRGTADAVTAIADGALVGAPVQAQVGAVTLALVAARAAGSRPYARRATIRGAARALASARPGAAPMRAVTDRMLALLAALGPEATGESVARAFHEEAEAIIAEAWDDHGAMVGHLLEWLPGTADEPLPVLLSGSTGTMAGGQFGTAQSAVQAAHHAGRPVSALVTEARPGLEGARVAAWELQQAGVPYAVVTDAAAPGLLAAGEAALVLATADRVAANGDVIARAGTYPLALAAAAAGVPLVVCAPSSTLDPGLPDGAAATLEEGRPGAVLRAGGIRVAPSGSRVRNPVQDRTPAALVSAIVTAAGVLRAPFEPGLAAARAAADARRASSPGFAALLAQGPGADPAAPPPPEVDLAAGRRPAGPEG